MVLDVHCILLNHQEVQEILRIVKMLNIPDAWVGAGCIRNRIWDYLHEKETPIHIHDIDVIFFDSVKKDKAIELAIEYELKKHYPKYNWSVKNQARISEKNGNQFTSCYESISYWPETATAIAARIDMSDQLEVIVPYGVDDLIQLKLRPTPHIDKSVFKDRIQKKDWLINWPKLSVVLES